jgi:hypothetical protein
MSKSDEKRYAPRFKHRCHGTIVKTGRRFQTHLINISSTGVLVAVIDSHDIQAGDELNLIIELSDAPDINLLGVVAHTKEHYIGIESSTILPEDRHRLEEILALAREEGREI